MCCSYPGLTRVLFVLSVNNRTGSNTRVWEVEQESPDCCGISGSKFNEDPLSIDRVMTRFLWCASHRILPKARITVSATVQNSSLRLGVPVFVNKGRLTILFAIFLCLCTPCQANIVYFPALHL